MEQWYNPGYASLRTREGAINPGYVSLRTMEKVY